MIYYRFYGCLYEHRGDRLCKVAVGTMQTRNGIQYQLNQNHRWQRVKDFAIHEGDEVGRNVAAWKAGKVIGGAVANHAIAMGADPMAAQLISETVVQAGTATALWAAQQARKGTLTAEGLAAYFVQQSAAAALGKMAHHEAEHWLHTYNAQAIAQQVGPILAGKGAGLGTVATTAKTKAHTALVDWVVSRGKHDLAMLGKVFGHDLAKAADPQAIALLWQLHQAGIAMAAMQLRYAHDEHQP
jgi:hypothetical protein